jgi:hypothetical protein
MPSRLLNIRGIAAYGTVILCALGPLKPARAQDDVLEDVITGR